MKYLAGGTTWHFQTPELVKLGSSPKRIGPSLGDPRLKSRKRGEKTATGTLFIWPGHKAWKLMHIQKKRCVIYSFLVHKEFSESCWPCWILEKPESCPTAGKVFRMLCVSSCGSVYMKYSFLEISTPLWPAEVVLWLKSQALLLSL